MISFNMLSIVLLVLASILSFFLILGFGLSEGLGLNLFPIVGVFAAFWAITYIWQSPLKDKYYKILFSITGTIITYNILLSTLFLDPRAIQDGWIFIGTPVVMLAIWCFLIHRVTRKNVTMHWLVWILFIGILLFYAWDITSFYYINIIS